VIATARMSADDFVGISLEPTNHWHPHYVVEEKRSDPGYPKARPEVPSLLLPVAGLQSRKAGRLRFRSQ
jgi:hypothetical protein